MSRPMIADEKVLCQLNRSDGAIVGEIELQKPLPALLRFAEHFYLLQPHSNSYLEFEAVSIAPNKPILQRYSTKIKP